MGGFTEISDIRGPGFPTGTAAETARATADGIPLVPREPVASQLYSTGFVRAIHATPNGGAISATAGIITQFHGRETREIIFTEELHHTFDPVLSGKFPALDTVFDPGHRPVDPAITTGEQT